MYDFEQRRPQLESLCKRFGVTRLMAFGSAVRDDFTASSDIDLLVSTPRSVDYLALCRLQEGLETLFNRPVDLITDGTLETMNRVRKKHILSNLKLLYAS